MSPDKGGTFLFNHLNDGSRFPSLPWVPATGAEKNAGAASALNVIR